MYADLSCELPLYMYDDESCEGGFSMQQFLGSFIAGFVLAIIVWITYPVDAWRVSQVLKAYVTLNWTHTREVSYVQELLNSFQLPFTLAGSREQAAVQHVVSGAMGASIPIVVGCLQGFPPSLSCLTYFSQGRKRMKRTIRDSTA
eukprot:5624936-Pyramimonas_sp.AAC.1